MVDNDNDLKVAIKRNAEGLITQGVAVGDADMQDVWMVLSLNQGDLKEDPIAGVNLTSLIRGKADRERIKATIKIGLKRCGISFDAIKDKINIEGVSF